MFYDSFAKNFGVVAQDHLLEQLGLYLSKAHLLDEKREKEKNHVDVKIKPRDKDFIRKIIGSEGHCSGFTPLFLYAQWLQDQPRIPGREHIERDDLDWLNSVLNRLAKWKGDIKKLSPKDGDDFDRLLNHLEFFQNINDYAPQLPAHELAISLEDTRENKINREYSLGGMFTQNDLISILPKIIKDKRLMLITSHNHTVGLYKNGDYVYFYDSNKMFGKKKIKASDSKKIAKQIFRACFSTDSNPSPIDFRNFTIGSVAPATYPTKFEILDKTDVMTMPKFGIDFHSEHANQLTGLLKASDVGDIESVKYYLAKGADIFAVDKHNLTPLEHAIFSGHADTVSILLKKMLEKKPNQLENEHLIHALEEATLQKREDVIKLFGEELKKITPSKIANQTNLQRMFNTAIMGAAKINDKDLLAFLLIKSKELGLLSLETLKDNCDSLTRFFDKDTLINFIDTINSLYKPEYSHFLFTELFNKICRYDRKNLMQTFIEEFDIKPSDNFFLTQDPDAGRNPFHYAILASEGDNAMFELMEMIDEEDFKKILEMKDKQDNNVLHLAIGHRNGKDKFEFLCKNLLEDSPLALESKLKEQNQHGNTPLHSAINAGGSEEIMAIHEIAKLISPKNDSNQANDLFEKLNKTKDAFGNTPLHKTINRYDTDILNTLLKLINSRGDTLYKHLIKDQNNDGNTGFHLALRKNNLDIEILKKLISPLNDNFLKILFNTLNKQGKTPLDIAKDNLTANPNKGNKEAVDYLFKIAKRVGLDVDVPKISAKSARS